MATSLSSSKEELIEKISKATKIEDLVKGNIDAYKKAVLRLIHPDVCDLKGAKEAVQQLNSLVDARKKGLEYEDEGGKYKFNGWELNYSFVGLKQEELGSIWDLHKKSYDNWSSISAKGSENLNKYIPQNIVFADSADNMGMRIVLPRRAVSIHNLVLEQKHVNWVLSRLLEFSLMMNDIKWTHGGISPDNVFIDPENHGIFVTSFYHSTIARTKMKTINGNYSSWYPRELFKDKIADAVIDIELSKRLACYLLGDKSGVGVKLRKTANPAFMNFVLGRHDNPMDAYKSYRNLLEKNFEKKFHILNM